MRKLVWALALLPLAACEKPSEAALARAHAPPPAAPQGILASTPPRDPSFNGLRCLNYGPDTECSRTTDGTPPAPNPDP